MGARVYVIKPFCQCGYTFKKRQGHNLNSVFIPKPYSKINSSGEEVILTKEEADAWMNTYCQVCKELGLNYHQGRTDDVYHKVEEILKKKEYYRFL